ncbi:MAG: hypothetical protein L0H79_00600 [Intrasporangium sp.]|uniref:hypothetical protein n=1 Tax=Intrasporangium sp. TaxID=1925024 RepID=UPI00264A365B|nr:hypothetical protein [Intrasporangium sp.]MDN5794232.1 hypothetical protein [Intrasporangium sp.]
MKRLGVWLVGVLATVALVVGTVVAVWVGPDDVIALPQHEVASSPQVVVTAPTLLAYSGTTLRVTASADRGAVFIGAGHPVDVASYLGDAKRFEADHVSASGEVSGRTLGSKGAPTAPETATFWSHQATDEGSATLDVPLTGAPIQVVMQYVEGATSQVGLGVAVPGLFRMALSVAAVGLVLIAVLLVLRRRRRRAPDGGQGPPVERPTDDAARASAPTDASESEPGHVAGVVIRRGHQAGVLVLAASSTFALSGCLALPSAVPASTAPVTKTAVTAEEVTALLKDYDQRNNAAIAALAKKFDIKLWDKADTGPVLAADRADSAIEHAVGEPQEKLVLAHAGGQVYSPRFAAYPMWSALTTKVSQVKPTSDKHSPSDNLRVFSRASATAPWRLAQSVPADVRPAKALGAGDATATTKEVATSVALMKDIIGWFEGGSTKVKPSTSMNEVRNRLRDKVEGTASTAVTCRPYLVREEPKESLRAVRTSGGVLTVMTLQCHSVVTPVDGQTMGWKNEYAKALQYPASLGGVWTRVVLVTVAVETQADKKIGIGATADLVRSPDVSLK